MPLHLLLEIHSLLVVFVSQYLNLIKSMPTASHVGRTKLDKERLKLCQYEVESVCTSAQELKAGTRDDTHIKDNLKAANALLQRLLNIAVEVSQEVIIFSG